MGNYVAKWLSGIESIKYKKAHQEKLQFNQNKIPF